MQDTTTPFIALSGALAKALRERVLGHIPEDFSTMPEHRREFWLARANALLASGVVIDAATLADDEALVLATYRKAYNLSPRIVHEVLRALAAALAERGESA